MSKTRYIEDAWNSLKSECIPADAGPIQVQEMRRAFYAGAQSLVGILMNNLDETEDPDEVTVKDEELWENVNEELVEFLKNIQEGKA